MKKSLESAAPHKNDIKQTIRDLEHYVSLTKGKRK